MTDTATTCDECGVDIAYGERAWAVPMGETEHGEPVVQVICVTCYEKAD